MKGMTYVEYSAQPNEVAARIEHNTEKYSATPLMHFVQAPCGTSIIKKIPMEQYRYLRWKLQKLKAGESKVFSARVSVTAEQKIATEVKAESIVGCDK
jgi:hypothetical protein